MLGPTPKRIEHTDPSYAKMMVDYYLRELSDSLREEALKDVKENRKLLRAQIEKTSDVLLKGKIYTILAERIKKQTPIRAQNPYGFQVLNPPTTPDLDENVKPNRILICVSSAVVAFFMAVFLALFMEYINNVRNGEDPERLERFRDSLRLKKNECISESIPRHPVA